jgi:POT family proton-dependent oligopeptide transporter
MGAADSLLVLALVPVAGAAVPALARVARARRVAALDPTPLRRMTVGMFVAAAAFAASALLEARIDAAPPASVPVLAQLPQYALLVVAEVLVSTTGLEFAFTEAGAGNRGAVLAAFYLTTAAGDALNGVLYAALGGLPPVTLIWLVAAMQVAAAAVFAALARAYVPRAALEG